MPLASHLQELTSSLLRRKGYPALPRYYPLALSGGLHAEGTVYVHGDEKDAPGPFIGTGIAVEETDDLDVGDVKFKLKADQQYITLPDYARGGAVIGSQVGNAEALGAWPAPIFAKNQILVVAEDDANSLDGDEALVCGLHTTPEGWRYARSVLGELRVITLDLDGSVKNPDADNQGAHERLFVERMIRTGAEGSISSFRLRVGQWELFDTTDRQLSHTGFLPPSDGLASSIQLPLEQGEEIWAWVNDGGNSRVFQLSFLCRTEPTISAAERSF